MTNIAPSDAAYTDNGQPESTPAIYANVPVAPAATSEQTLANLAVQDAAVVIIVAGTPLAALFDRLRIVLHTYLPPDDILLIYQALTFAHQQIASTDRLRPLCDTGIILAEMHIDATGIVTGMLQHLAIDPRSSIIIPAVNDTVMETFGPDVAYLLDEIAHFGAIERRKGKKVSTSVRVAESPQDRRSRERQDQARKLQIDTIRKMFMAMGDDPRIVIFRLAEHLRQMRDRSLPIEEGRLLAQEARDIYAPLAGRLGMSRYEAELEDLAFAQLEPEEYRRTANLVSQVRAEQRGYIESVCAVLVTEAAKVHIQAEAKGRYKHLWSIYRKLIRNGWDIHQIYDLIAFRVLVPEVSDCYAVLGQVHGIWPPREDRIKDFISRPKPNGYQSLHTTVFCIDKRLAEVQIRTHTMHKSAEYGVAMHWYYKDVGDTARADKKLSSWLQQLKDWQSDLQQQTTGPETIASSKEEIGTRHQVFVFTPNGDVKDLPAGSTPVDFAYRIHTSLGDHCAGARVITPGEQVTQRMVPLDYVLVNGEIVEILTHKNAHPTRDWIKFVRTQSATQHIKRYLKQHEKAIYVAVGRERFERDSRQMSLDSTQVTDEMLRAIATKLNYETVDDMFAAVGGDTLRASVIVQEAQLLVLPPVAPTEADVAPSRITDLPNAEIVLDIAGAKGLLGHLASCCHPLIGDPVVGYISRGRGIIVHHQGCHSLKRLREREEPRFIPVDWQQLHMDLYEAAVIITARDRTGLIRDIAHQIQELKINMGNVNSSTSRKGKVTVTVTLQISVIRQLEDALKRLRTIKDVEDVDRDTRSFITVPS